MSTHLAAVCPGKGQPFQVQTRSTPKPGPDELLIAVKSVALNPADVIMRDQGLFITEYPTVIGFDMSGLVLQVGENVPSDDDGFQPGTRVAAYSASAWRGCAPDYGPFQEKCLVPWQHAVRLPDQEMSWNHAATLPVSVQVPLSAWDMMGIPRSYDELSSQDLDQAEKKEALLIWGASSSIGTMGVQTARLLCQHPKSPFAAVYATAGQTNHNYIRSLGADRVFDYKDPKVVESIVAAAKEDGLVIRYCFLATGNLSLCQAVLKEFIDISSIERKITAKIGSAPWIPADAENVNGVEVLFVMPSAVEEERLEQFKYWIGNYLSKNMSSGNIRPSPEPKVVGRGLKFLNSALEKMSESVSCTKLVVEIGE
ncbi:zinc-binding alcohol dehydrogenase domain protein [Fusarium tjaetaba]|uniref:Zinc-binding alcohol dehydrogenase domain protein n=1 Tax=Fusarium tjaetaba TaxID=1567544 RepID=A0A8H5QIE8_9HYPO|nr:zinc-binding alcohol dehydrogenase domain protein [Fusarium tjaetaba]KAF5615118.1 zinc-binding alcohol dehydrogenase domain protein [Fusarium tjaetaba]